MVPEYSGSNRLRGHPRSWPVLSFLGKRSWIDELKCFVSYTGGHSQNYRMGESWLLGCLGQREVDGCRPGICFACQRHTPDWTRCLSVGWLALEDHVSLAERIVKV